VDTLTRPVRRLGRVLAGASRLISLVFEGIFLRKKGFLARGGEGRLSKRVMVHLGEGERSGELHLGRMVTWLASVKTSRLALS